MNRITPTHLRKRSLIEYNYLNDGEVKEKITTEYFCGAEYVNGVKPTEATKLQASIKASTNRTVRTSNELTALAIGVEVGEL